MNTAMNAIFTQVQATLGFKLFGEKAVADMIKELKQLEHGLITRKRVVEGICPDSLSVEGKKQALNAVNLIKKKRDGTIKRRTCANGSSQHKYLKENESITSPMVSLEGLLTTLIIDAFEGRQVATFDIPKAYLHAEMPKDKKVLLKLRGIFVDIMCDINPEYEQYVRFENGVKVLYLRVLRAIYGCIESALQWYVLYKTTLEKEGFELNPYDLCIANKVINNKQFTLCWYVDDNKASHADKK